MTRECSRSADVAAAASAGTLDLSGGALGEHVSACASCRDLALVVAALREERDRSRRQAPVPSAGLVWWRAQLRERREAARRAAAPVTLVHAATLVGFVVLAVVLVSAASRWAGQPALIDSLPAIPSWGDTSASLADAFPVLRYGLALGATAWLILGPVALYFAFRRD